MEQRGQQRPGQQVVAGEQVLVPDVVPGRLGQPDGQQLARVVPLVQRLGRGDALVALQPDQRRVQRGGQRLGRLGLADPGFAFEQDGLAHPDRQEQRRGQLVTGQVANFPQGLRQRSDLRKPDVQIIGHKGRVIFVVLRISACYPRSGLGW